jgi:tetratricopeptide (TPR) repeat protein
MRPDVEGMLAAHDTATRDGWLEVTGGAPLLEPEYAAAPTEIAGYEILGVIGAGGMGTVYRARQKSPQRDVAIKVVRADRSAPTVVQRFLREAEILGRLQHPAIAQIYESGVWTSDSGQQQPYFVMELVEGLPLDRYASERRLAVRDIANLLIQVCDGVHHAHQKGVIHRDLKPANILVTAEGQPKVVDFGVARLLDSQNVADTWETQPGEFVGTLPYMSPEQLDSHGADADTRTDVYALGVAAYRTLTGQLPYEFAGRSIVQIARMITETAPRRLRSVRSELDRDLELIVHRAFARDPDQRYASAADLGDDLRTFLAGGAVTARPPSFRYKLRVFARQHRLFAAALLLAFVTLTLATGVSTTFAIQAARANVRAEQEATKAEATLNFLLEDLFGLGNPDVALTTETTILEAIDRAAAQLGQLRDPGTRARIQHVISVVYANIGTTAATGELYHAALDSAEQAVATLEAAGLYGNELLPKAMLQKAICLRYLSRYDEAMPITERAIALARELSPANAELVTQGRLALAASYEKRGDRDAAEALVRGALDDLDRLPAPPARLRAQALLSLANLAMHAPADRRAEAEEYFRRTIELCPADENPTFRASALCKLAELLKADEPETARELIAEAVAVRRAVLPDDHRGLAQSTAMLGALELEQGNPEAALPLLQEAETAYARAAGGEPHLYPALMQVHVGKCHQALADYQAAVDVLARALEQLEAVLPPDHWYIPNARSRYGECLIELGRREAGRSQLLKATAEFAAVREQVPADRLADHEARLAALGLGESGNTAARGAVAPAAAGATDEEEE